MLPNCDPVFKVSIISRGMALGYTMHLPEDDRYLQRRSKFMDDLSGLLGGRAAEELVFGEVSTGASNDLEKVADIVRNMLTVYGMSRIAPNLSLVDKNQNPFLGQGSIRQHRSEKLEESIDAEMQEIIAGCYEEAKNILQRERGKLQQMAQTLLQKEKINEQEILTLLGPREGPEASKRAAFVEFKQPVVTG